MLRKDLLLLVSFSVLGSCGGSTPTAPEGNATNIVSIGPQVLRIGLQSTCTQLGQGVLPVVYTRVSVALNSTEWVAMAASGTSGDIQVRFHQSGPIVIAGSMSVAGTITGTAIHMPELFPLPSGDIRATFGGPASLTGTAFVAGVFGATANGIDGVGSGPLTLTDATGNICTGTSFSWSIFPPP